MSVHSADDTSLFEDDPTTLSKSTTLFDAGQPTDEEGQLQLLGASYINQSFTFQYMEASSARSPSSSNTSSEILWPCKYDGCFKTFHKRYQLNKHSNTHFPKYRCSFGCKAFAVKRDRDRHVRDRHSSSPTFACPVQGCKRQTRMFKRDDNLLRHLEKVHHLNKEERDNVLKGRA